MQKNLFINVFWKKITIFFKSLDLGDRGREVRLAWFAFVFALLNEFYIVITNTWYTEVNSSYVFPSGPNPFLVVIFLTWVYTWGVSNLRRTLFGKFTRGDRRLWFKAFASFWVVELVTVGGLYLVSCWMSWGPAPVIHRNFLIPNKGFIVELSFFTFIVWGLYLLRFFLKWNSWVSSSIITVFLIMVTTCLVWRDFTLFWGRETMLSNQGSRWRYIDQQIPRYSLCPEWWTSTYIGNNKFVTSNMSITDYLGSLNVIPSATEYESSNLLSLMTIDQWFKHSLPFSSFMGVSNFNSIDTLNVYGTISSVMDISGFDFINRFSNNTILYPRRVGFATKKLGMWTLFVVLKMWHHIIMFYWWFLFLLRLYGMKKNAYSILSTCWFNVYCCFIIGLLVYLFSMFPFYENFLRLKPFKIRSILFRKSVYFDAVYYVIDIFTLHHRKYEFHIHENRAAFKRLVHALAVNELYFVDFDIFNLQYPKSRPWFLRISGASFIYPEDLTTNFCKLPNHDFSLYGFSYSTKLVASFKI